MNSEYYWEEPLLSRIWVWFYSVGHIIFYIWIGLGAWAATIIIDPGYATEPKRYFIAMFGVLLMLIGIWYLISIYQIIVNQLWNLFIVKKLKVRNEIIVVKGYYFKSDKFAVSNIRELNIVKYETNGIKQINSIFSKNQKNICMVLDDGRNFYFRSIHNDVSKYLEDLVGSKGQST